MTRYSIAVQGIVQGVGFRPFVFRTAAELNLSGFVRNTEFGVYIEIEGSEADCDEFMVRLNEKHPPMASIYMADRHIMEPQGSNGFVIVESSSGSPAVSISPDIGICDECAADVLNPNDRRYGYAFTNCTNCGPRFTIIRRVPYDRKNTAMSEFEMCNQCALEYNNPLDRRFHAQPNACASCGPSLKYVCRGREVDADPIEEFAAAVRAGRIIAVKGLGGYHLACDASDDSAVLRLREMKLRYSKPLAVMVKSIAEAGRLCIVSKEEEALLLSRRKPIVLLRKNARFCLSPHVAPNNLRVGVMLPYTPLHVLLMEKCPALVLTSANLSDSPMLFADADISKLYGICDAVLTHNREILRRMDDSVCFVQNSELRMVRRARGWVPEPLKLPYANELNILALGAQQKNTFCLVKADKAYISGHIGDMDDFKTEQEYNSELDEFVSLFNASADVIVRDMHPDYVTSHAARELAQTYDARVMCVQHHHAHFASVLAEHGIKRAIGFIFDGTGYGEDGTIWGGEVFVGDVANPVRIGGLEPFRLPGAEAAIKQPWRSAAYLICKALDISPEELPRELTGCLDASMLLSLAERGINAPLTSSMGRLFDAIAAIAGVCRYADYDGQPAIELEQTIDAGCTECYRFDISQSASGIVLGWRRVIGDAFLDMMNGVGTGVISAKFHNGVVQALLDVCINMQEQWGKLPIVLSGGVFQNIHLLDRAFEVLTANGYEVYTNEKVPANDGGISFGQAVVAAERLRLENVHCKSRKSC